MVRQSVVRARQSLVEFSGTERCLAKLEEARWSSAVQVKLALTALKCPFSCGQQGGMGRLEGSRYILFSMAKENLRAHLVAKIRFFNS